jgi:hydrogenase-4 component B
VVIVPCILLILGAILSLLIRNSKICNILINGISAISCLLIIVVGVGGILSRIVLSLPLGLEMGLDSLSSVFCVVLGIVGFSVSTYSIKYMEIYGRMRYYGVSYTSFILAMYLILIVRNAFWFIFFWELMTLSSYLLVVYEDEKEEVRRAGFKYFVMTHIGVACIIAAVLLLYQQTYLIGVPDMSFSSLSEASRSMPSSVLHLCYLLLLVGFLVKTGAVPLHSWLPDAHPAAPSNISALLSGFMIKTAVYAIIRMFFFVLPMEFWCGILLIASGLLSMFFGGIYALKQVDSKRLLAYSSVENMGYILLGIGAGLSLLATGNLILGSIALSAGILHTVNHAMFKALLFLSAGSVIYRTGKRNMDVLGGLGKYMGMTSSLALIGSLSASGVPVLNGFVSKWLIYSVTASSWKIPILPVCAAVAVMISAITGAFLLKYWSSIFTGRPSEEVKECPRLMIAGEAILAVFCFILGVYPMLALLPIVKVSEDLGIKASIIREQLFLGPFLIGPVTISTISLIAVFSFLSLFLLLTFVFLRPSGIKAEPWFCGTRPSALRFQASSYYRNLEEAMRPAYIKIPRITLRKYEEPDTDRFLVKPIVKAFGKISRAILAPAMGYVQLYLALMFLALLLIVGVIIWIS